jgi:hypothetical protein
MGLFTALLRRLFLVRSLLYLALVAGYGSGPDRGGNPTMFRTFSSLRLFVTAAALLLAVLAAPAAHAQSVIGSGTFYTAFGGYLMESTVNVDSHGNVHGSVSLRTVGAKHWGTYAARSLVVVGNQATVTTDSGAFVFTNNGDGSVEPDYVNFGGLNGGFDVGPLVSGDIKVSP